MGSKVGCFADFCHHQLATVNVCMHVYCYHLFESGTETGLGTIALCRKDLELVIRWAVVNHVAKESRFNMRIQNKYIF